MWRMLNKIHYTRFPWNALSISHVFSPHILKGGCKSRAAPRVKARSRAESHTGSRPKLQPSRPRGWQCPTAGAWGRAKGGKHVATRLPRRACRASVGGVFCTAKNLSRATILSWLSVAPFWKQGQKKDSVSQLDSVSRERYLPLVLCAL